MLGLFLKCKNQFLLVAKSIRIDRSRGFLTRQQRESGMHQALSLTTCFITLALAQTPLICEDNISGQPPFRSNDVPCLLGCGTPLAMATGGLLPGSINTTDIPYCELDCVRSDASPAQSSAAPECDRLCRERNSGTPEQLGWCMYWCVQGGDIEQMVVSTTCVPSIEYVPATTSLTLGGVFTYQAFSNPAAWTSWYATQTAIPRSSLFVFGSPSTTAEAVASAVTSSSLMMSSSGQSSSSEAALTRSDGSIMTSATALGEGASSEPSTSTSTTTTSTSGQAACSPAVPALAIALLFAVSCF